MLNSFLKTDFITRGLPSISNVDLENKPLIEQLEYCNINYLIYLYSTPTHYKKSIRLLQKFIKRSFKDLFVIEQIWLTCIKFNDRKLLKMNMTVYKRFFNRSLDKLRIFKELDENKISVEDDEIRFFNNKCTEIFTLLCNNNQSFTYQSFLIYKKYNNNFFMDIDNKMVYNYKCGTDEYIKILKKLKDFLLNGLDINILFLYTYISKMGCLLTKCNKKCYSEKETELRKLLLNDLFLEKVGIDDRNFLLKFFKRNKECHDTVKLINYEKLEPLQPVFKAVVHTNEISSDNKYVTRDYRNNAHKKNVYTEEMYSIIGCLYTKRVRDNLIIEQTRRKKLKHTKKLRVK